MPADDRDAERAPRPAPGPGGEGQERVFRAVYGELHGLARRRLAEQPAGHTLQPTALVSEAWLRLRDRAGAAQDHDHFLRLAARAMRQILVDHARRRASGKRPPAERRVDVALEGLARELEARALGLDSLDDALRKLEEVDPDLAQLVELHFFGGRTMDECARMLGISQRQAFRRWRAARAYLHREIRRALEGDGGR